MFKVNFLNEIFVFKNHDDAVTFCNSHYSGEPLLIEKNVW